MKVNKKLKCTKQRCKMLISCSKAGACRNFIFTLWMFWRAPLKNVIKSHHHREPWNKISPSQKHSTVSQLHELKPTEKIRKAFKSVLRGALVSVDAQIKQNRLFNLSSFSGHCFSVFHYKKKPKKPTEHKVSAFVLIWWIRVHWNVCAVAT